MAETAPVSGPAPGPVPGPVPDLDERPLADCLEGFWEGRFAVRRDPADPAEPADVAGGGDGPGGGEGDGAGGGVRTALDGLGPSGITVRGRDLADLLAPAYRWFTGG